MDRRGHALRSRDDDVDAFDGDEPRHHQRRRDGGGRARQGGEVGEVEAHRLHERACEVPGEPGRGRDREVAQLGGHEREVRTAAVQRVERRAEQVQAAQRVDIAAVRDREQRRARGQRRERGRREPVRDDRVPAAGAAGHRGCHPRGERGGREQGPWCGLQPVRRTARVEEVATADAMDPGVVVRAGPARGDDLDVVTGRAERPHVTRDEVSGRVAWLARIRRREDADEHQAR